MNDMLVEYMSALQVMRYSTLEDGPGGKADYHGNTPKEAAECASPFLYVFVPCSLTGREPLGRRRIGKADWPMVEVC